MRYQSIFQVPSISPTIKRIPTSLYYHYLSPSFPAFSSTSLHSSLKNRISSNMYPPKLQLLPKLHSGREMSAVAGDMKARAEVCYGDESCREKFMLLLSEIGLPNGLLTIGEIEECGYVKDTGFVWLRHKKRDYRKFENVEICCDAEITAYFERNKIKKLTGVKAKEFLIWITLSEIYVNHNNRAPSITFKTPAGLSKSFPLSIFKFEAIMVQEDVKEVEGGEINCK